MDGLTGGVFAAITRELRVAAPDLLGGLDLVRFWSYKYANAHAEKQEGIKPHADRAYANLNLWLTPDEASLNAEANGMTVFGVGADDEASFDAWQQPDSPARMARLQRDAGVTDTRVPYKCNRIVLFNSRLVHKTGVPGKALAFRPGYANRRINLTWLFGHAAFADHKPDTAYDGRGRFVAAAAAPRKAAPAFPPLPLRSFDDAEDPPPPTARRRAFSITGL